MQASVSKSIADHPGFGAVPVSWNYLCSSCALRRKPIGVKLGSQWHVGYRTESGQAIVLNGRCAHLGADLASGTVCGERLACPLHGWEYGPQGDCEKIPASKTIPSFARLRCYPTRERAGHVFFFNQSDERFPLPFFDGLKPADLYPAQPFEIVVDAPWHLVGANGFDVQHFRCAHDRLLTGEPQVSRPSPFAFRISAEFQVTGRSWRDRLTRAFSGTQVHFEVTSWAGNFILVRAAFPRTTSYGMVCLQPLGPDRTLARIIVWVRRKGGPLGRYVWTPANSWIRRSFIRAFLEPDVSRLAGLRYQREHLIDADKVLSEYLDWLETISNPTEIR
ncbi:MAG TPA: Rieske 2Fe-2S domain-containing protein [Candidatus Saccharimonadales bacterium]|nr:Rieske 2Fe-2S domain-containing protein [Candidatus Saccharimonadales bacterium]